LYAFFFPRDSISKRSISWSVYNNLNFDTVSYYLYSLDDISGDRLTDYEFEEIKQLIKNNINQKVNQKGLEIQKKIEIALDITSIDSSQDEKGQRVSYSAHFYIFFYVKKNNKLFLCTSFSGDSDYPYFNSVLEKNRLPGQEFYSYDFSYLNFNLLNNQFLCRLDDSLNTTADYNHFDISGRRLSARTDSSLYFKL